jgi:hypothetical protein
LDGQRSVTFPARLRPRLPGGAVHRVELDDVEMRITTIAGLYGNRASRAVLTIPHWRLAGAEYVPPEVLSGEGACVVRYVDEKTEEHAVSMIVVDPRARDAGDAARRRQNEYTEKVALALERFRRGGADLPDLPSLELAVPGTARRVGSWIAFAAGLGLAIWSQFVENPLLSIATSLVGLAVLAALGASGVRSHTAWHPAVKAAAYVLMLTAALTLFVLSIVLGDVLNLR